MITAIIRKCDSTKTMFCIEIRTGKGTLISSHFTDNYEVDYTEPNRAMVSTCIKGYCSFFHVNNVKEA